MRVTLTRSPPTQHVLLMAKPDLTMGEMKEAIARPGALMRLARGVLTGLVVLGLVSTLGAQVASGRRSPRLTRNI